MGVSEWRPGPGGLNEHPGLSKKSVFTQRRNERRKININNQRINAANVPSWREIIMILVFLENPKKREDLLPADRLVSAGWEKL